MINEPGSSSIDLSQKAWKNALEHSEKARENESQARAEERREKVRGFKPQNYDRLFVRADTTSSENVGGTFQDIRKAPPADIGRYGVNNGVLAFATANRDYYIADPNNSEVVRILEEAGFVGDGVTVPHSNDGGRWFKVNVLRQPV